MARKFLVPIDLNGNEIQNVRAQNLGSDPGSPTNGQFWYDSTNNQWKMRINAATRAATWVTGTSPAALTVAGTVVLGTGLDSARSDHVHAMPGLATAGVDGFLPGTDKTKLNNATATPTASVLAMFDASGKLSSTATAASDAVTIVATKGYVDALAQGLDVHASVRLATTTTLALTGTTPTYTATGGASARGQITWATGPTTVDSVTLANGDRIFVKDEAASSAQHGIWVRTSANTWDRATDWDADVDVTAGAYAWVEEGTINADSGWIVTTNNPIITGGASGTALTITLFASASALIAGSGLGKTGNVIDVNVDNSTIEINADTLRLKDAGTTYAKFQNLAGLSVFARSANSSGVAADVTGTLGQVLRVGAGPVLGFGTVDLTSSAAVAGALPYNFGGTGQSAYAAGDIVYASATNTLAKLAAGTNGYVLTLAAGVPTWAATSTNKYTTTIGDGAATSIVVTHNLNTRSVVVSVYQNSSTWDVVDCDVQYTTVNTVTLLFTTAPTSAQYACVVMG